MNRRFPEPRITDTDTPEAIRWMVAQRAVYLTLRDAYEFARKRA